MGTAHQHGGLPPPLSASEGQQNLSFSGLLALQPSGDESAVPLRSRQRAHNIDRSAWAGHVGAKTGKHIAMRLDQGGTRTRCLAGLRNARIWDGDRVLFTQDTHTDLGYMYATVRGKHEDEEALWAQTKI